MSKEQSAIHSSTGYWVTLLARAMEGDFEDRLKVHGITRASAAVLNAIHFDKKSTPAALASFIGIDGAAITRHLDRIEKQGLIVREHDTSDRRSINLTLTSKGKKLAPKIRAASKATNEKFLMGISPSAVEDFQSTIGKMLQNGNVVPKDI